MCEVKVTRRGRSNNAIQQLEDARVHDWYRFVLAYPDHLVSEMMNRFNVGRRHTVLDPFVGMGTTLVECKERGVNSVGIDANPVAAFATQVKTTWDIDLAEFDIREKSDLRQMKKKMMRSHTRNIYVADNDSDYVADVPEIQAVAQEIERRRIERGATSGFERLYHRVVTEYFGGMYRVLEQLQQVMSPGGKLALVVGDQMSYFRVPVRTAKLLSLVARRKLGYAEVETLVWRTRRATATKMNVEEHILILERR